MRRIAAAAGALLILSGWSVPASAFDPITLIVLRALRDQLATSALQQVFAPGAAPLQPGYGAPAAPSRAVSAQDLRDTIASGFPYLSPAQREAVYGRLTQILADPRHAADRQRIVQSFTATAAAMREINERLEGLTDREKRSVAAQVAEAYRHQRPREAQALLETLRAPAVPIPPDLRQMMLAELPVQSALASPPERQTPPSTNAERR